MRAEGSVLSIATLVRLSTIATGWARIAPLLALLHAADAGATAAPSADATAAFQRGTEAYKAGAFEAAVSEFSAAYTRFPSLTVLFNLALAHDKAGHSGEALARFRQVEREFADAPPNDVARVAPFRDLIHARIRELEGAVAAGADGGTETAGAAPDGGVSVVPRRFDARTAIAASAQIETSPTNAPAVQKAASPAPGQTRRWWWIAAGILLVGAATTTVVLMNRSSCDPKDTRLGCMGL